MLGLTSAELGKVAENDFVGTRLRLKTQ
jgi:hypothetical protein